MKVLILSPYTVRKPAHGGALRVAAIVAAYKAAGHEVTHSGVYDPGAIKEDARGPHDIALTAEIYQRALKSPLPIDIALWRAMAEDSDTFGRYDALVRESAPDVIQLEEPALWPVMKRLLKETVTPGTRLVHSSHNVETYYRRELAEIKGEPLGDNIALIETDEREIAAASDAVFTVSKDDERAFRKFGSRRTLVALNGSSRFATDAVAERALKDYLGSKPHALFVSSAHPPNAAALIDLLEPAPKDTLGDGQLLVAGSVGRLIADSESRATLPALRRRTRLLGFVEQDLLGAMYASASVIILPKLYGGGSNLKTSEALISGRPIVATTKAFIGFEAYADLPWVKISDDPSTFWSHVDAALAAPMAAEAKADALKTLDWRECLKPMVDETTAIVAGA